jgi:hypothetical protein
MLPFVLLLMAATCGISGASEDDALSSCTSSRAASNSEEQFQDVSANLLQVDLHLDSVSNYDHGKEQVKMNGSIQTRNNASVNQSNPDVEVVVDTLVGLAAAPDVVGASNHIADLSLLQTKVETQANGGLLAVFLLLAVAVIILAAIWLTLPDDFESIDKKNAQARQQPGLSRAYSGMQPRGGTSRADLQYSHYNQYGRTAGGAAGNALAYGAGPPVSSETRSSLTPSLRGQGELPPTSGNLHGPGGLSRSATASFVDSMHGVPPVCPSLILPNTEARFMIELDHLIQMKNGGIEIKGTSGRTLLHANLDVERDQRRVLKLASVGCEQDPRTTVRSPQIAGGAFELTGKSNQPYGSIEISAQGTSILKCNGQPVMLVEKGHDPLFMTAKTMDGQPLAEATTDRRRVTSMQIEDRGGQQYWKLVVKPGADAVLITTCMLSIVLLGTPPNMMSGGSFEPFHSRV